MIGVALRLCVSITLLARGWLTYRWDSPIRGLCWHEEALTPLIEAWAGVSWEYYAAHSDAAITTGLQLGGLCLMVSAILPWLPLGRRWLTLLALPAMLVLGLDAWARIVASGYQHGSFLEKAMQCGTPWVWLLALHRSEATRALSLVIRLLAAATFIGHGLYAVGYHPVPWHYQSMTYDITGMSTESTLLFLRVAGYLDFAVAVAIFIRPAERWALGYMVLWGGATALARYLSQPGSPDPWLVETLVRTAHWLLPLILLGCWRLKLAQSSVEP